MLTFRHAGDLGDIVYSMPIIRALGGGLLFIEAAKYTRQFLTPDKWCGLDLLCKSQSYIAGVFPWERQHTNFNLNDFRARMFQALRKAHTAGPALTRHLTHWMCEAHGLPDRILDDPWLTLEPTTVAPVVMARAGANRPAHQIYQNPRFPWHRVWQKYKDHAVFIGTEDEHRVFCATCGKIPFHQTANLFEAAKVIAGSTLFVGNQSAPHAIAEGLKKRIVLEVWPQGPNCLSFRPGVYHGHDEEVELPEL